MEKLVWVKQIRGTQQTEPRQKATLRALGLRGIGSQAFIKDSRAVRGMLNVVQHMVQADLVDPKEAQKPAKKSSKGYKLG